MRGDFIYGCLASPDAVACIDASHLSDEVRFYQKGENVLVVADMSGMPTYGGTGFFAMHIHEGDNCCDEALLR